MSFKDFYTESKKVFVAETEDGFQVINADNYNTMSESFETFEDAVAFVETKLWSLVEKDEEWDELNGLSLEVLEEMESDDFGTSIIIDAIEAEELEYEDELSERLIRKKVVRNGKRMIKIKTDKPGYRVSREGGRVKEVRMKAQELRKRKRGQRIAGRKRKAKAKSIQRKRLISFKKRIK